MHALILPLLGAGGIVVDGAQERGGVERERMYLGVFGAQLRASGDWGRG